MTRHGTRSTTTRWLARGAALTLLAALAVPVAPARGAPARVVAGHGHGRAKFATGSVLVSFRSGVSEHAQAQLLRAAGARPSRHFGVRAEQLSVPAGQEEQVVAALRSQPSVRYAEPDYLSEPTGVPSDPAFSQQWAMQNTGQTVNGITGTAGADADVVPAWAVTTGSRAAVVAVVDTGVDYTHPDLAANIWTNDGSVGGCPAGTHGFNVLNNACDPMDDDVTYGGHGTHVAGIIGAVGDNGAGVAGMSWTTSILPVKWIGASGAGATSDLVRALGWVLDAQAHGVNVRVVNDSNVFIGTAYSQALADELDVLAQHDILFVTAAGSSGDDNDNPAVRRYPCAYARSNELCATWTDQQDRLASSASSGSANYGSSSVDLAAPGDNIYSTLRGGAYGYVSGGSMAAAAVSGAATLVLSHSPMTARGLKADLLEHLKPLPSLAGLVRNAGRLDVCAAMPDCGPPTPPGQLPFSVTTPPVTGAQTQPTHPSPEPQQGQLLTAGTGDWDFSPTSFAYAWSRCSATGGSCVPLAGATSSTYSPSASDVGATLRVTVTAGNAAGTRAARSVPTMVVQPAPPTSTFGKTAVAATSDPADADWERLNAVTVPQSGTVTGLTVYLARVASGSQSFRGVVYTDASGLPGSLAGSTSAVTLSTSAGSGWVTLPFAAPLPVGAGAYWIGVQAGPTTQVFALRYDESTSGSGAVAPAPYASGPLGTSSSWRPQAEQISLYGTLAVPVPPPSNLSVPTVSGAAKQGKTLTASPGTWTGSPTAYSYQWLRCSSGGCSPIAGAVGSTYLVSRADVGSSLEVKVVASNSSGASSPAVSAPTGTVRVSPSVSLSACGSLAYGTVRRLVGQVTTDPLDADGRTLSLQWLPFGQASWSTIRSSSVSGSGTSAGVVWPTSPTRRTEVRAVFAGDTTAEPAMGNTVVCSVSARPSLTASARVVPHLHRVRFGGGVAPSHAGSRVYLQVYDRSHRTWRTISAPRLSSTSHFSYARRLDVRGTYAFRLLFAKDSDHLGAVSPTIVIRVV